MFIVLSKDKDCNFEKTLSAMPVAGGCVLKSTTVNYIMNTYFESMVYIPGATVAEKNGEYSLETIKAIK